MSTVNSSLRTSIARAYVAHRLNHQELVQVVEKLKNHEIGAVEERDVEAALAHYADPARDARPSYSQQDVDAAVAYLELDKVQQGLSEDQPWTPMERAIFRRLSHPQVDPVPSQALSETVGHPEFVAAVMKRFDAWDQDGDGSLTPSELDEVMADPNLTSAEAAAAVILRRQGPQLAKCETRDRASGVTPVDLERFLITGVPDDGQATIKVNRAFPSLAKLAEKLPPAPLLMEENFDPEMVQQGRAGSCVLLSTLSNKKPEDVKSMFHARPDGMVEVTFEDGHVEVVRDLTLAERLYHARSPKGGRWPGLLEMGLAQRIHSEKPKADGSARSGANAISPDIASQALFGKRLKTTSLDNLSLKETRELLISMAKGPKPWICGSRSTPKGVDSLVSPEQLFNGISNNHAYTIRGFDPKKDLVHLRNPWRKGEWVVRPDGHDDGKFSMDLKDFYSSFRWVGSPKKAS
jgi:hypothetical protein